MMRIELYDIASKFRQAIVKTKKHGAFNYMDRISYRDMKVFDLGFDGLMEKLKLYVESNPPGVGKVAGLKLIHRLEELETDDDQFPQYQIEAIRELIGEI